MSDIPYEVQLRARDIIRDMFRDPLAPFQPILERALMAEREWVSDQLKDPHFVRSNWLRGGINAQFIVSEERRRAIGIADVVADEQDVLAMSADESNFAGYRQGERVAKQIADLIGAPSTPDTLGDKT
ncbi:MAG: hypothetical protein EOO12_00310 [Chitinophagaceae bacterium]|nr:MAG: hypothetical protein EOO12_00310 [Chitinophagaceae bacterium]